MNYRVFRFPPAAKAIDGSALSPTTASVLAASTGGRSSSYSSGWIRAPIRAQAWASRFANGSSTSSEERSGWNRNWGKAPPFTLRSRTAQAYVRRKPLRINLSSSRGISTPIQTILNPFLILNHLVQYESGIVKYRRGTSRSGVARHRPWGACAAILGQPSHISLDCVEA